MADEHRVDGGGERDAGERDADECDASTAPPLDETVPWLVDPDEIVDQVRPPTWNETGDWARLTALHAQAVRAAPASAVWRLRGFLAAMALLVVVVALIGAFVS